MKSGLLFVLFMLMPPHVWTGISGQVSIFSETPFSNLDASSGEAQCVLSDNRSVSITVPLRSFIFSKAMMQEHFNEHYLESRLYRNASFKGEILENVDFDKTGVYPVKVKGRLRIHGVSRERTINGNITADRDKLILHTVFMVKTADHNIDIPHFLGKPVCENVEVTVNAELIKKSL